MRKKAIYSGLKNRRNIISFSMPGHKNRRAGSDIYGADTLLFDTTELYSTDNLLDPKGIIKAAQNMTAEIYGAKHAVYLTGGATLGIYVMMLSALKRGDKIIISSDSHTSVINAAAVLGIKIVLANVLGANVEIPAGLSCKELERVISEHKDAKAVFVTSPNYFGICSNIHELARIAKSAGMFLFVDEAHGAHFPFISGLKSSISCGADMAVVSVHKTMPALTGAAILLIGTIKLDIDGVMRSMRLLSTTSPSFLTLTSMEDAIYKMGKSKKRINTLENHINLLRNYFERLGIGVIKMSAADYFYGVDPFKLVLDFWEFDISGKEVLDLLRRRNIEVEMSFSSSILLMFSINNTLSDIRKLKRAVKSVLKGKKRRMDERKYIVMPPNTDDVIEPSKIIHKNARLVNIRNSVGRVAKENVVCFPPCVPIIFMGEVISREKVEYVLLKKNQKCVFVGMHQDDTIWVLEGDGKQTKFPE